jgi:hypothetical protein
VLSKKGSYAVDFPEVEDSRIVEFVIEAKDYGGNSVSESGQFVIESKQVENNTTNGQTGEKPQEFPWIYVLAGAIFIIVVFYIVKSLGKK